MKTIHLPIFISPKAMNPNPILWISLCASHSFIHLHTHAFHISKNLISPIKTHILITHLVKLICRIYECLFLKSVLFQAVSVVWFNILPSVHISFHWMSHLFVYLSTHLFTRQSVHPFIHPKVKQLTIAVNCQT